MSLFAIGDFHLSGEPPAKPMEVFSPNWENHFEKIRRNWLTKITETDTVIICGDTSWAMSLEAAMQDLNRIAALPGQKIILRGNHDYWWTSLKKMQQATEGKFMFLQNNFFACGDVAVCGSRGWILPSSEAFTDDDRHIYLREGISWKIRLPLPKMQALTNLLPHCITRRCIKRTKKPYLRNFFPNTALRTAFSDISTDRTQAIFLKAKPAA